MIISIIVAMDDNGVIGAGGTLPWHLSSDLKHFKSITMGKPIVMGRKTYESIERPLPGRENIIVTRDKNYIAEGCIVLHSLDAVYAHCCNNDEIMIMGGADLYTKTLDKASRIYMTEVHTDVNGDVFFPKFNRSQWKEIECEDHLADDKNEYDYSFVVLERK
jgi:dihydrofolate reductase